MWRETGRKRADGRDTDGRDIDGRDTDGRGVDTPPTSARRVLGYRRVVTHPGDPSPTVRPVEYKGEPLDAARGPGLGCFWIQLAVLGILLVLTPLSVGWGWPSAVSVGLLVVVLVLLLFAGQTVIFLLRLVAADRRAAGRRRPLASATPTVGELEDAPTDADTPAPAADATSGPDDAAGRDPDDTVRQ